MNHKKIKGKCVTKKEKTCGISRGDNEPDRLASYSGSARSKLGSSELDSGSCLARDLNKSSRANPSSARKAREQARNNHIHIIHE
ncbi:hypothetical protein GQ457_06G022070 [Hibiscus cannabinus]